MAAGRAERTVPHMTLDTPLTTVGAAAPRAAVAAATQRASSIAGPTAGVLLRALAEACAMSLLTPPLPPEDRR
jgi:hypothetical protein